MAKRNPPEKTKSLIFFATSNLSSETLLKPNSKRFFHISFFDLYTMLHFERNHRNDHIAL